MPWYKKKRTIAELALAVLLCLGGIIAGAVIGSRRSPPPPCKYAMRRQQAVSVNDKGDFSHLTELVRFA